MNNYDWDNYDNDIINYYDKQTNNYEDEGEDN